MKDLSSREFFPDPPAFSLAVLRVLFVAAAAALFFVWAATP